MKDEFDSDTNQSRSPRNNYEEAEKETRIAGNLRKNWGLPNHNTTKIS